MLSLLECHSRLRYEINAIISSSQCTGCLKNCTQFMSFKGQKEWRMFLSALSAQKVYVSNFNNQNRVYMAAKFILVGKLRRPKIFLYKSLSSEDLSLRLAFEHWGLQYGPFGYLRV